MRTKDDPEVKCLLGVSRYILWRFEHWNNTPDELQSLISSFAEYMQRLSDIADGKSHPWPLTPSAEKRFILFAAHEAISNAQKRGARAP